jgi:hypothetical protein
LLAHKLTIRTTCTIGSATHRLYLRLSQINSLEEKTIRCAARLTTSLPPRLRCRRCPTPVGQSRPAASENQNSILMVVRSRVRGVALSEVCPCARYYELQAECQFLPDGPALRATALITYANWLLADNNITFVTNTLWPVIQLDLDYVATWWNQSTCVFTQVTLKWFRLQYKSTGLISGRKYPLLPSLQQLYSTGRFARARR